MRTSLCRRFGLAAFAGLLSLSLTAQSAPGAPSSGQPATGGEPPPPLFGEQIEVRVVNIEVVVTDKKGDRVPDLQPKDFRLKVDGKVVPIEFFTEVRGGQAIAPVAGGADQAPLPGLPSLAPGSAVGTSYLVFIDNYFSIQIRRDEVLKALKDDLSRLGPEDRMAIVAFDGRKLTMLTSWSSSQHDLARAIDQAIGEAAHGLERTSELNSYDSSRSLTRRFAQPILPTTMSTDLNAEEVSFADRRAGQIERVVSGAVSTMRSFASPPGRKVMLLLSGGWPFTLTDYVTNDPTRPIMTTHQVPSGQKMFAPLVESANRLGYTLYPIDVPGVQTQAASAATNNPVPPFGIADVREQEEKGSLTYVAGETGGKAMLNSLRLSALKVAEGDTRAYYWMGFTPSWQGNDKRHVIAIDMQRSGLKARFRDSFLDRSRKSEISMMVESAMLFGSPPGTTQMPVHIGSPVKKSRTEMEVAVSIGIPTNAITVVPINGKYASEVELRVAALDDTGERSDIPVLPIQLSSEKQPEKGKYVRYDTKLRLRRTQQHLTFAIFDPLSNRITTAEADVKP
jgi:VWFA-related protein